MADLSVTLGRLELRNPVLVASGTFGYARELAGAVDFARLGGVISKTVTRRPRAGNAPPRTVETASGMLNATGGLSGPAIKPLALRLVWRVARHVRVPVIGIGGIASVDDAMEFLVAGASAVQVGTANFYDPTGAQRIADRLPGALAELGAT